MQRQFYAALFRKLKSIGNIWDVAKLTPAVLNYMETNLSASDLIILWCRLPWVLCLPIWYTSGLAA